VVLAIFNMFPVPPLDGSRVADYFMPPPLRPAWEQFKELGPFALLALILLPRFMGISLIQGPHDWVLQNLVRLIAWIV
jgi:Zn-dependent protease